MKILFVHVSERGLNNLPISFYCIMRCKFIGSMSDTGDALQSARNIQATVNDSIDILPGGDSTFGDEIHDFIRQHKDPSSGGDNGVREDMQLATSALQFNDAVVYNNHYAPSSTHLF